MQQVKIEMQKLFWSVYGLYEGIVFHFAKRTIYNQRFMSVQKLW